VIDVEPGQGDKPGMAYVRHTVETRGRFVTDEDMGLIETEARAFERFVEHGDLDTTSLLEASRRVRRDKTLLQIGLLIAVFGTIVAVAVASFWRGFWLAR